MAKPILIITMPVGNNADTNSTSDWIKKLQETMSDYHILMVFGEQNEIEFKVLAEKDYLDIDIKSIKESLSTK